MLNINPQEKVLDLGCGDGLNIKILKQMGVRNIVGVDISKFLLKLAQKNNPDVKFYLASVDDLPFDSFSFDIVLADSVFHHLIGFSKSLKEIERVLKRRGRLYFIDPHKSIIRKLLDLLTVSCLADYLPFFKDRKPAYFAERDLINNWLEKETSFLRMLEKNSFKKDFLKIDLLSCVGSYQKT